MTHKRRKHGARGFNFRQALAAVRPDLAARYIEPTPKSSDPTGAGGRSAASPDADALEESGAPPSPKTEVQR